MTIPNWYGFILLFLAAYRVFRLIAEDDILERPRRWFLNLPREWEKGDRVPEGFRDKWSLFITCPACAGFWITVAWWAAYQITNKWTLVFAVPFAANAVLIFLRRNLDPAEE